MSRPLESLVINPLFYDLLSGEFTPVSDELNRTHTLAKLSVAAWMKGEATTADESGSRFLYTPSWAPLVTARVCAEAIGDSHHSLTEISLAVDGGSNVLDIDLVTSSRVPQVKITHEDEDMSESYPLELNPSSPVKERVATYANAVFTRAHISR